MIIVMRGDCHPEDLLAVEGRLQDLGYQVSRIEGIEKTILGAVGAPELDKFEPADQVRGFAGVEDVIFLSRPYRFVAREYRPSKTVVDVRGVSVGGPEIALMAGPCTVESEGMLMRTAEVVARSGARILRGGAYKPSTSPYSFQGLGVPALEMLKEAACRFDLRVVTEVMDVRKVDLISQYADMLQIGARSMQNYDLLREVGQSRVPVLLKRGMNAKLEEWLLAAEYIASAGNDRIVLCERGIRTFEPYTRNTLDLSAVPALASLTHLPVVVDPSHGTGRRELVPAMAKAALACGADGLLIEVHPTPDQALKDGMQSLSIDAFKRLSIELAAVASAVGRRLAGPVASPSGS